MQLPGTLFAIEDKKEGLPNWMGNHTVNPNSRLSEATTSFRW